MAISKMAKVIIVSHQSEASVLLESLQKSGICQMLNAEEAMVSKETPELCCSGGQARDIEDQFNRLRQTAEFLKGYSASGGGLAGFFAPRAVVDEHTYDSTVVDEGIFKIVEESKHVQEKIEALNGKSEDYQGMLEKLGLWRELTIAVEQINQLGKVKCVTGMLQCKKLEQLEQQISESGAVMEVVGRSDNKCASLVACLNEDMTDIQKLLRSADFEEVSFGEDTGTVAELIEEYAQKLNDAVKQLQSEQDKAKKLAKNLLQVQILCDHYSNLLEREETREASPATEKTVIFEAWVRQRDYEELEKTIESFGASSVSKVEPGEDENIPVEIENKNFIKPFEVVTRLYGMPQHFEVDPTALLAPFFAIFFALCLTDAGYGLIIIALTAFLIKKMQGDKKLIWMLLICSVITLGTGVMTGGWFGDGAQQLASIFGWTWLANARESMMWFDPMKEPMIFFNLSLAIGYLHIMVGIVAALVNNLVHKKIIAAICDQVTWLVMLNSIVLKLFGEGFGLSPETAAVFGKIAIAPAVIIVLFSQREGNWAGRIGMGCYQLFSTIFYMGDVLSYLRLMALGMVTGGLAMAFNVMAATAKEIPYVGYIAMIVVLIVGHLFNTLISGLSAFVHTIRLQFVEFFPKFLEGGGVQFQPLTKRYKYIYIDQSK